MSKLEAFFKLNNYTHLLFGLRNNGKVSNLFSKIYLNKKLNFLPWFSDALLSRNFIFLGENSQRLHVTGLDGALKWIDIFGQ